MFTTLAHQTNLQSQFGVTAKRQEPFWISKLQKRGLQQKQSADFIWAFYQQGNK